MGNTTKKIIEPIAADLESVVTSLFNQKPTNEKTTSSKAKVKDSALTNSIKKPSTTKE